MLISVRAEMGIADSKPLSWAEYARYVGLRLVLWFTRDSRTSRFAGVHRLRDTDAFRFGALPSSMEFQEEWPYARELLRSKEIDDRVTIFCTSAQGQILMVNFTRRSDKTVCVFLYLRTLRTSYSLTREYYVDLSVRDTFSIDGLKLECMIPMRRWRVSFNGLLK